MFRLFNLINKKINLNRISIKYSAEADFWKDELDRYVKWYDGIIKHYGIPSPQPNLRITSFSTKEKNAAVTWSRIFQENRYLEDFKIQKNFFQGDRILDIGCGPLPSALVFTNCNIYGLDHLIDIYRQIGYPIDEFNDRYHFIQAKSEVIPFESNFFDAVISANAIDHVDDINKTSQEIKRVLKPKGKFRMHVHYHAPTPLEPISLNDSTFVQLFGWVQGLKKIGEYKNKDFGYSLAPEGEQYILWAN